MDLKVKWTLSLIFYTDATIVAIHSTPKLVAQMALADLADLVVLAVLRSFLHIL